jgi:hypothetical protein
MELETLPALRGLTAQDECDYDIHSQDGSHSQDDSAAAHDEILVGAMPSVANLDDLLGEKRAARIRNSAAHAAV